MELAGFEIIEQIGHGGMATVWRARQVSLDRNVAIKVLNAKLARDPSDVQRFQAEAQAAAKLKHPGIVQVYDAHAEEGLYCFVMEHIEGETVGEWVRRKGRLAEKDALQIADCVGDALMYAWNKERITHCDIKPDNIMLDADGTVKVADLGLARTIHSMSSHSAQEEILGTPSYMSPEQARGDPNMDFRADIYSLGAMLYHLVTGKMPFEGLDPEEVMDQQSNGHLPDPIDLNPKLSRGVCSLIEKMMWKTPEGRHGSWESVIGDIALIRKRHVPKLTIGATGESTVRRSSARIRKPSVVRRESTYAAKRPAVGGFVWTMAAAALLFAAGYVFVNYLRPRKPNVRPTLTDPVTSAPHPAPTRPGPKPHKKDDWAQKQYEATVSWVRAHPDDKLTAIRWLRDFAKKAKGTKYAALAEKEASRVERELRSAVNNLLANLSSQADVMVQEGRFRDAISLYERYSGPFAKDTADARKRRAGELKDLQEGAYRDRLQGVMEERKRLSTAVTTTADFLLKGDFSNAINRVEAAIQDGVLESKRGDFERLRAALHDAAQIEDRVLRSFEADIGREVTVSLGGGTAVFTIDHVGDGRVEALENRNVGGALASRRVTFAVADLAAKERLERMGSDDDPVVALVKGLMAWNAQSYATAKKYFEMTDPLIAGGLASRAALANRR